MEAYTASTVVKIGKTRKPLRVAVTSGSNAQANGNGIGISTQGMKNVGVCSKCGCKRRHARTCPLKKKGDDDEDIVCCCLFVYCCLDKINSQSMHTVLTCNTLIKKRLIKLFCIWFVIKRCFSVHALPTILTLLSALCRQRSCSEGMFVHSLSFHAVINVGH